MKNKLICMVLTVFMVASMLCFSVFAEDSDFVTYSDFENYSSIWDGTTIETILPDLPNVTGEFCSPKTLDSYSGITSGTAKDSKYGNSMKIVQKPNSASTSKTYTYFGFDKALTDSVYLEFSMNIEASQTGKYAGRAIRMNTPNAIVYPIYFVEDNTVSVFSNKTDATWLPDTWYDIKVWYNISTGAYKVKISDGTSSVLDTSGTTTAYDKVTRFLFYMPLHRYHASLVAAGEQITYFDNFKLQQIYGFENPGASGLDSFNFETYKNTSDIKSGPADGSFGSWKWGASNSRIHGVFAQNTDRDTSLSLCAPVYEGPVNANGSPADTTLPNGNLTVSQLKYPKIYYTLKKDKYINDTAYLKTSAMFPDKCFSTAKLTMGSITLFTTSVSEETEYSLGDIYILTNNEETAIDTGLNLKLNEWYDIEATLNIPTGYMVLTVSDSKETYQYSGFLPEAVYTPGTAVTGFEWDLWNRTPRHDWSVPTKMYLDDIAFGTIGEIFVPRDEAYDFVIDKRKTTTGFDKVIDMTEDVFAAFSNKIDKTTFNPSTVFVNGTAIDNDDIVFVDDRTVKFTFDKTQNKSYKIDLKDVADVHGNTLT